MPKAILTEQGKGGGSTIDLLSIAVTTPPNKTTYYSGETFNSTGMVVTASYGFGHAVLSTAEVGGYTVSPEVLTDGITSVTISYQEFGATVTTTQAVTVEKRLVSIAVTTNPTKMTYEYGDTLNTSGMVVTATYTDNSTANVTASATCSPTGTLTTLGTQSITVSYKDASVSTAKTTVFNVTVNRKVVTKPTWKGTLTYNGNSQSATSASLWNNYNSTYMTISGTTSGINAGTYTATFTPTANYKWSDGTGTINVDWSIVPQSITPPTVTNTSFTYNGSTQGPTISGVTSGVITQSGTASASDAGTYVVTFALASTTNYKWSDNSITNKSTNWTISPKSITIPTVTNTSKTYNGDSQSPTVTGLDTNAVTQGGTSSATNVGSYSITFTLKSTQNYKWTDSTTTQKSASWSIGKASITASVSTSTLNITGSTLTQSATISYIPNIYDGTPTVSPTSLSGLTNVSISKTSFSVTGNGSTTLNQVFTISFPSTTNCNITASLTVTVNASYWDWGNETDIGDATWWAGLKATLAGMTTQQKKDAYLGKTKRMALGGTYLGSTHVLMRCVGCDQDGANTLAFNSVYGLKDYATFGSSAVWIDSTVRSTCQSIYNTCGAKTSIKTVKKGTCPNIDSNRNAAVTYNDETVFILSEREYGLDTYSSISTANSTTSKAECTQGYNESYQYYDSNDKRKMKKANVDATAADSADAYPWERSRGYDGSGRVCNVSRVGGADRYGYSGSNGLAPAFVIG